MFPAPTSPIQRIMPRHRPCAEFDEEQIFSVRGDNRGKHRKENAEWCSSQEQGWGTLQYSVLILI